MANDTACLCPWVGHGACGGCSGVIGIIHEPSCGWEWNPACPVHGDALHRPIEVDRLPEDHVPSPMMLERLNWPGISAVCKECVSLGRCVSGYDFCKSVVTAAVAAPLFTYGQKRKVFKIPYVYAMERPWQVANHPQGYRAFQTWQQAMDYANWRGMIMNEADAAEVQKEIVNFALHGESTSTIRYLSDGRNQVTVHDHHPGP